MARVRSPSYPSYSLEDAIENAQRVFDEDRRNPLDRGVAAKHLGYSSLNGAADKALATMMQYGLFEKVAKGEVRVSQAAIDLLYPDTPEQKRRALRESAYAPPLFQALKARFEDGAPSSETLRSYLLRENFNDRAVGPIITAYTKTCALLERENASESGGPDEDVARESAPPTEDQRSTSDDGPTYGGAKVGDLIQWESQGVPQFNPPQRVRMVSDDGHWVAVDSSETGIPMSEVVVEDSAAMPPTPPPMFPTAPVASAHSLGTGEIEWMHNRLGAETNVRLMVKGDMGPKEIGKLIKLLEAQRSVLEDD